MHRDLKPENIFLSREEDAETAKILDFGLAKSLEPAYGAGDGEGELFGTPAYMSPEQARGSAAVDHRSDLWSLGIVAFQCLTGRLPFDEPELTDLLSRILWDPLPVPSQLRLGLPPRFDAWFARATSRDVEARFQSCRELSAALREALGLDDSPELETVDSPLSISLHQHRSVGSRSATRLVISWAAVVGMAGLFAVVWQRTLSHGVGWDAARRSPATTEPLSPVASPQVGFSSCVAGSRALGSHGCAHCRARAAGPARTGT